jgi:flagellar basal body-associated protein FliL
MDVMKSSIPLEEIKALRDKGMSYGQIAIKYGVTSQCIQQRLAYRKGQYKKRIGYKEENTKLKEELKVKDAQIIHLETELRKYKTLPK